jgi:hypothetical protein
MYPASLKPAYVQADAKLRCRRTKLLAAPDVGDMLDQKVKDKQSNQPGQDADGSRQRLTKLREALLGLHKALLESERTSYERTFGKISSPYQFLQLLTNDPWFAWLHPMTQLITSMDETLDAKDPFTSSDADALLTQVKALLTPTESGDGFSKHYDEALQRDPDVVFAHATAAQLLRIITNNS